MPRFKGWSWWIVNDKEQLDHYHIVYAYLEKDVMDITGCSRKTHRITRATWKALQVLFKVQVSTNVNESDFAVGPLEFAGVTRHTTLWPSNIVPKK